MKRYLLFIGKNYYGEGGFLDHWASSDIQQNLVKSGNRNILSDTADWWHIVDTTIMKISSYCNGTYCGKLPDKTYDPKVWRKVVAPNAVEYPFPTGK